MLRDDSGEPLDLFWLRDSTLHEINGRLGEPRDSQVWEEQGLKLEVRDWWVWEGAVALRRTERVGPLIAPMVGLNVHGPHFTLQLALALSGLCQEDAPASPLCAADGTVIWNDWPGAGQVTIHYPTRGVQFVQVAPPPGGRTRPEDAQVFDITRRRRAA